MITIQEDDVNIGALIAAAKQSGTGAIVVFDGVVRDDGIIEIELEAYTDVAAPGLEKIARDAREKFGLRHVDVIHRIGRLAVGENILIIVVSAGHRPEAYTGSRYIIEKIKKGVLIWKKELKKEGGRWVPEGHGHGCGTGSPEG